MALTEKDFTPDLCAALVAEHGDIRSAAQAIAPECSSDRYSNRKPAWRTVSVWISKHVGPRRTERAQGMEMADPHDPERLNRLSELLAKANIDPEKIGSIKSARVKSWGAAMKLSTTTVDPVTGAKTVTETPHELGLHATDVLLNPIPQFPVIQAAPPTNVLYRPAPRILRKTRSIVVISDMQIGYLRDADTDELEPIHDPDAIDVAKQIVAGVAPDEIVFIGDTVDLPMFSRWAQHPEYGRTLQYSIDTGHRELAEFISAAGKRCTKRTMIGSNHDLRLEKAVLDWNKEALGVRRAGDVDGWPVFSLNYLIRLDELGIAWSGQYPGGEFYILPDLVAMHAPPKSKEFRTKSVIHGHTHSISRHPAVTHGHDGRMTHSVYDIGCLCQVGVTENKRRLLVTRTPSDRGRTSWLQGFAVVPVIDAHGSQPALHAVEQIEVVDGRALYGGRAYEARRAEDAA